MRSSRVTFDPSPANTSHLLTGSSYKRKGITFFPPQGETVTLSNDSPVALNKGITLQQGQTPVTLLYDVHGDSVCREWYVIGSLGTNPCSFMEIME